MLYSYQKSKERAAFAYGKEQNVSYKHANEICAVIKGMSVTKAIKYLRDVQAKKVFVPFRRYHRKVGHKKGGVPGRYPVKAAKIIAGIIQNAMVNAEYKGLDTEKLKIEHAAAYKSIELDRIRPKGRLRSSNIVLTNIEIVVKEV